ncbi:universal stress protein [Geobacter argillaceus]|jgi:nucleotide-binding universal stress UspA family protein|uniref:Universal stress protein n=1 Tax=Geobacter argillaceus TaxID=345631 RepID=A0A562WT43_9BACT|nr:universal stress protein [Geobacter argillaceus]TWJ33603.1 nucleotide-binding universal stress UspA family protein [Geobacter argillaceus]
MEDFKRILVVSRMTANCQKAVHFGVSLARKHEAELTVIHVIHNPFGLEGWNLPTISLEKEYQEITRQAKQDLDRILKNERSEGLAVTELIREGEPTKEILKAVKELKIDLLIMLAHQEWRLEHFLFGRSNEEIVRTMPCSVLLVKNEPKPVRW